MKRQLIVLALGSLFALPAFANAEIDYPQEPTTVAAKTVSQVGDELIAAQRAGNFVINAESGETAYQLNPGAYPAHNAQTAKSRADVLSELKQAHRAGDYMVNAETGETAAQL